MNKVGAPAVRRERLPAEDRLPAPDRSVAIHRSIQQAIVEQRLQPGTRLSEDQLGGIFGASRTLVRAALQSLARDGMVVLARNKGASVASPNVAEARALFDARRVIEQVTVERAASRVGPAELAELVAVLEEGRDALALRDRGRAIRMSGEFHLAISRFAGQPVLHEFLTELVARSSLVIALYGHAGRSDCGDAEHATLVDAFRLGDATLACRLMADHLDHIEADLDLTRQDRASLPLADVLQPDAGEPIERIYSGPTRQAQSV